MTRILVVDDVPVVRLVIGKILRRAGHEVVEAGDGAEALARIEAEPVDAVVTDLWMPGLDGLGLLGLLRRKFPHVARVGISGGSPQSTMVDSLDAAVEAGANVAVMKPVDKDELIEAVERALLETERYRAMMGRA